jgi:4-hydroxy-tetrahydrodipicolinate reductase
VIRVAVIGVTGRMGRAIVRAADESNDVDVVAGVASAKSSELGKDIGELAGVAPYGFSVSSDLSAALAASEVAIDFSNATATAANIGACHTARRPLVIGTTGFGADVEEAVNRAARDIAVLVAPNTSIGVTLLIELVREAARTLSAKDFDIGISETHHRHKKDAPSGTALALGRAAAEGRGEPPPRPENAIIVAGHKGADERGIHFAVTRGGDVVGEHSVLFAGAGEQLSLGHRATDRAIFARGALRAAAWLAGARPGRYAMRDVVGYKTGA